MKVTAWTNGSGAYGLKVAAFDRDRFFQREWGQVEIELPDGNVVDANINKESFWNDSCRELINAGIGHWLVSSGIAPWPKGDPPLFDLEPRGDKRFQLLRNITKHWSGRAKAGPFGGTGNGIGD